jgi:hypothetical protein
MTTIKITAAALIASFAIGAAAVPANAASKSSAITAKTTGIKKQDDYCRGVAKLVNEANHEADNASGSEEAEWRDLANEFQAGAERNGCSFAIKHRFTAQVAKTPSATATKAAR